MSSSRESAASVGWICGKCGSPLRFGKVNIAYLRSHFAVDLFNCSTCGLVLIPEELAMGKMQEVEKALEDK
jgi:hypothetical protein